MIKKRVAILLCSFVMTAGQMVVNGQVHKMGASFSALKSPSVISLAGKWKFALDSSNTGVVTKWFNRALDDNILLPGTTDEARKGVRNQKSSLGSLTRIYPYYGAAWYQRDVEIPQSWKDKHITFSMERTKTSTVWINDKEIGSDQSLTTAHVYDLSRVLTPGKHTITVRINNMEKPPVGDPHQLSDQTQTNWNGILGEIQLKATDRVWMDDIQIYPDLKNHTVQLKIRLGSMTDFPKRGKFTVSASAWNTKTPQTLAPVSFTSSIDSGGLAKVTYDIGKKMQLWDEFSPSLYKFNIRFEGSSGGRLDRDQKELSTGLREFKTKGTQFVINGKTIFLRGKHDACVFPLTGYAPMTIKEWVRVLRIAKSYGINHYRFHTWTPPNAAFEAADIVGIYMQPELPIWGAIGANEAQRQGDVEQRTDTNPVQQRTRFLLAEGQRILKSFGNHASFVMFALGNELGGSRDVMAELIRQFRKADPRLLYAQGSNNFHIKPRLSPGDDYWTTTMTGGSYSPGKYSPETRGLDVRSSYPVHSVGHVNNVLAGTTYNYSSGIKDVPVPVIGHEVGQFQVFPDFKEISKYTGVVQAKNLEIFRERLKAAGMLDQAEDFFRASGALAVLCYREEIETAIRTPGFGGFQLLDLQDFPGQGTALVGILDAFMDSKGLVDPAKWREFCSETVPLVKMKSFVWTNAETFTADTEVANYGPNAINGASVSWVLTDNKGMIHSRGSLPSGNISQGGISKLGHIEINLQNVKAPASMTLKLQVNEFSNSYPIWIYPVLPEVNTKGVIITRVLDEAAKKSLDKGKSVLLILDSASIVKSVPGAFQTDFWCYPMFKKYSPPGTLGILTNPAHGVFSNFPTESHSNWQWWHILKDSPVMVLDSLPNNFRPIIQVVDNFERNQKLGLLFEARVGKGRLIVSSIDLTKDSPEIRSLFSSIVNYMKSSHEQPKDSFDYNILNKIVRSSPGKVQSNSVK
ncbi:MAG: sugar-binding domain-containing protein [Bacteroidota bacterium]